MHIHAKSLQVCLSLCDLMDSSLPGSSVRVIFQARILDWVAFHSPGNLPDPGIEPRSLALDVDSIPHEPPVKPNSSQSYGLSIWQSLYIATSITILLLMLVGSHRQYLLFGKKNIIFQNICYFVNYYFIRMTYLRTPWKTNMDLLSDNFLDLERALTIS